MWIVTDTGTRINLDHVEKIERGVAPAGVTNPHGWWVITFAGRTTSMTLQITSVDLDAALGIHSLQIQHRAAEMNRALSEPTRG
jgi:hypothetical protein